MGLSTMAKNALIQADSLSFSYGDKPTLKNINFTLAAGKNLGILGESGSGKSTLLKVAVGLLAPDAGTLKINGQSHHSFGSDVQMIFQDPHTSIDPRQKIRSVIAEPLISFKLGPEDDRKSWIEARVVETLIAVGLSPDALDKRAREFSGGQRQRIAIARAIITEPKILLADEPVSALDLATKVRIIELLSELTENKATSVVLVSHDMASIAAIADEVLVMKSGEIVEQGDKNQILQNPQHPYTQALLKAVLRMPSRA